MKDITMQNGYYVYRFINYDEKICYVGRTINLYKRFMAHDALEKDIKRIEYIICDSEADMGWKEIYYINYFKNKSTKNSSSVFKGNVTDIGLNDTWIKYKRDLCNTIVFDENRILNQINLLESGYYDWMKPYIHIEMHEKINKYGKYDLTQNWFLNNDSIKIKKLSDDIANYFKNIRGAKSVNCMWTTFPDMKNLVKKKGFTKGFIDIINSDETTQKINLAYIANNFVPATYVDEKINNDNYALTEMLQFIWRSAIRDGKEINIYIPSIRMRTLLQEWIKENSLYNI